MFKNLFFPAYRQAGMPSSFLCLYVVNLSFLFLTKVRICHENTICFVLAFYKLFTFLEIGKHYGVGIMVSYVAPKPAQTPSAPPSMLVKIVTGEAKGFPLLDSAVSNVV